MRRGLRNGEKLAKPGEPPLKPPSPRFHTLPYFRLSRKDYYSTFSQMVLSKKASLPKISRTVEQVCRVKKCQIPV